MSEVKWSDLVYVQRDVEDKDKFAENWDRIFGKKDKPKENDDATKEGLQSEDNQ